MLPLKLLLNDFVPGEGEGVVVGVGLLPYMAYTGMCRWTGYIILCKSVLNSVHDLCKYVLVMKLRELS